MIIIIAWHDHCWKVLFRPKRTEIPSYAKMPLDTEEQCMNDSVNIKLAWKQYRTTTMIEYSVLTIIYFNNVHVIDAGSRHVRHILLFEPNAD